MLSRTKLLSGTSLKPWLARLIAPAAKPVAAYSRSYSVMLALEPRVMLDAAIGAAVAGTVDASNPAAPDTAQHDTIHTTDATTTDTHDTSDQILDMFHDYTTPHTGQEEPSTPENTYIFVDRNVEGFDQLMADLSGKGQIVVLASDKNGLEQIAGALAGKSDVESVHIFSHGTEQTLTLGSLVLSQDTIDQNATLLQQIGGDLNGDADILLYGCNFGQQSDLVNDIASLTGADIAASRDYTGAHALNGNWDLEVTTGHINTTSFSLNDYQYVLSDIQITDLDSTISVNENTVNDTPQIIDSDITISGGPNFEGLVVTVGTDGDAQDQLGIQNEGTGAGQIGVAGHDISYEGTVIGHFTGGANGTQMTITLNADADATSAEALIEHLTYANSSDAPAGTRDISITLDKALPVPQGPEFPIDTTATGDQSPSIAPLASGGYVMTWTSTNEDGNFDIYGQRYDADGTAAGSQFVVNTDTDGDQDSSAVATLADGGFVVTWKGPGDDGSADIFAQRYTSSGVASGSQLLVNTSTDNDQITPSITAIADGGFIIAWESADSGDIFARRYASDSTPFGTQFGITLPASGAIDAPSFTALSDGGFLVTWGGEDSNGYDDIFAQRYDVAATPVGSVFTVNTSTAGNQVEPTVTPVADGGFVITWRSVNNGDDMIMGQRYDSSANAIGPEFTASTTTDEQLQPSVISLSDGSLMIAWQKFDSNIDEYVVVGRTFTLPAVMHEVYTVTADVSAENDAPAAINIILGTDENTDGTVNLLAQVYDPDSVITAGSITVGAAAHGTAAYDNSTGILTYTPGADYTGTDSVTYTITDGDGGTTIRTVNISVSPSVTITVGGLSSTVTFAENTVNAAPQIIDSSITLTTDLADFNHVVLTVTTDGGTEDVLGIFDEGTSTGQIGISGSNITYEGTVIGSFHGGANGTDLVITLNGAASTAATKALVQHLTYANTSDVPTGSRNLSLSFDTNAPIPSGSEFVVTTGDAGINPTVTTLADGKFIVMWNTEDIDGDGDTYGQLYNADGSVSGSPFLIPTTASYTSSSVAALTDGGFVVIWEGEDRDIHGQRYDSDGTSAGSEFMVTTTTAFYVLDPLPVAGLEDGGFVVTWHDENENGGGDIHGQRYSSDGTALGSIFIVNTTPLNFLYSPSITALADGGFVVTWNDGDNTVYGQRYNNHGGTVGAEFIITISNASLWHSSQITSLEDSRFLATWYDENENGDDQIYGQIFDASGAATGPELKLLMTNGAAQAPAVTAIANGGFFITATANGDDQDIIGQRYNADGTSDGSQFILNSNTTDNQWAPAVTVLQDGRLLAIWGTDDDGGDIRGQIFDVPYHADVVYNMTINVTPENDAPVAYNQILNITENAPGSINLLLRAHDIDSTLTGSGITTGTAAHGDLSVDSGTGIVTYTPDADYTGTDSFTYTVADGDGGSITRTVNVTVRMGSDIAIAGLSPTVTFGEDVVNTTPQVIDSDVTLTTSIGNFDGFVLRASADGTSQDQLSILNEGLSAGEIGTNGMDVTYEGTVIGTFTGGANGAALVVTLNGDATKASIEALIEHLTYANASNAPAGSRDITITLNADSTPVPHDFPFQINTSGDYMDDPDVATFPDGSFIVVWSGTDSSADIIAQRYNADGTKSGSEFTVNTTTANSQDEPSATALADGSFVVIWRGYNAVTSHDTIYGQMYHANGSAMGSEFIVSNSQAQGVYEPSVAATPDGGFNVVWRNDTSGARSILGQRYDSGGAAIGAEFLVKQVTTGTDIEAPAITTLASGGYVVTWDGETAPGSEDYDVYGQLYDVYGAPTGSIFTINTTSTGNQQVPAITALFDGGFVVAWQNFDNGDYDIYAQQYDPTGTAMGSQFLVNADTSGPQESPTITALDDGGFLIVWQDTNAGSLTGQRFDANGTVLGIAFQTTIDVDDVQGWPHVTVLPDNKILLTYQNVNNSVYTINGQIFDLPIQSTPHDVTVTITPDNDAPTASDISLNVDAGSPATINLLTRAHDPDGPLTGTNITVDAATHGSAVYDAGTGIVTYNPSNGFVGTDTFTYTVDDGAGGTVTQTVTIHVREAVAFSVTGLSSFVTFHDTDVTASPQVIDSNITLTTNLTDFDAFTIVVATDGGADDQLGIQAVGDGPGEINTSFGSISFEGTVIGTYTGGTNGDALVITLNGDATAAAAKALIENLTYANSSLTPTGARDITISFGAGTPASQGPVLDVSTGTTQEHAPDIAGLPDGGFIVTWYADTGTDFDIYAQRFNADGTTAGSEIHVNANTSGRQDFPSVTVLADGGFVITWDGNEGDDYDIYGQRFDTNGATVGAQFMINTTTPDTQDISSVAALADGGFVVTWQGYDANHDHIVMGQRYDDTGTAQGAEFQISMLGYQEKPTVIALSDGGFLVTWDAQNTDDNSLYDIYGQRFDASGTAAGSQFMVNTSHASDFYPSAVLLNDGSFVVTWTHETLSDGDVYAQRFDSDGIAIGSEFTVNTTTANEQHYPFAAALPDGGFLITWQGYNSDSGGNDIYGQRYNADGTPCGIEFTLEQQFGDALAPTITALADGGFAVAWENYGGNGESHIFARTFALPQVFNLDKTVTVNITSSPGNIAPTASDTTLTTDEDTAGTLDLLALANDTETILTGSNISVSGASHGTASYDTGTGIATYTPTANYNGSDSFTYTVDDGDGGSVTKIVTVTVTAINDAPTASDTTITTSQDTAGTVDLFSLAADIDSTLTKSDITVGSAAHGTASYSTITGIVTYSPNAGYTGSDSFTYTVDDGDGGSVTKTVSVAVGSGNTAPTASDTTLTTDEDTAGTVNLLSLSHDAETTLTGSNITVGAAGHGTATYNSGTGIVTYTPTADYAGPDSFSYTVSDGDGGSVTKTVTVTVTPVNDAPTASDTTLTTNEDTAGTLNLFSLAHDIDSTLTNGSISVSAASHGTATYDTGTGIVTYTPTANYNGTDSFTYTVSDGDGGSVTKTVTVTVTAQNDAPTASDTTLTTDEDTAGTVDLLTLAHDTETTLTAGNITVGAASHGTASYNNSTGVVTYTPAANYNGPDSFTYTVNDGDGGSVTKTVTVTVTPINDAPTASDTTLTTGEDTAGTVDLFSLAHDIDSTLAKSGITVGAASHGTAIYDTGTGLVTYTPAADYNGADAFTYTVNDGDGGSVTKTVSVTVTSTNDAPTASDTTLTTSEDTAGTVNLLVLSHDTETTLTGSNISVGSATHGSATLDTATGIVTYTPTANYNGSDSFSYTVTDGNGSSVTKTVSVTVTAVNDAPTASDATLTTNEDTAGTVDLFSLAHDIDSTLTKSSITVGSATHGTASYSSSTGIVTYTPAANYNGADSFTYTVDDGDGSSVTKTVSVTVTSINDVPTASNTTLTINEDTPGTVDLLSLSHDTETTLTGSNISVGSAAHGTATLDTATGIVTYTPAADYNGSDSFTYTVNDGDGGSVTKTVTVTINAANDAPTAIDTTLTVNEDTSGDIDLFSLVHDVDSTLTHNSITVSNPSHGTAVYHNGTGIVTYTPSADYSGTDSFNYTVDDGTGGTVIKTVTVTINAVNDAPTASDTTLSINEDTPGTVNLLTLAHDSDSALTGSNITVGNAAHGTASYNSGTGIATYTPNANYNGGDSFTYTVDDGAGGTVTKTVTVSINAVNDAPTASDTTLTTDEDTAGTVNLLALASDVDNTLLASSITIGNAAHGTAVYSTSTGIVTYTPNSNYNGPDSFNYTVSDGAGGSVMKTVSVTVTPVNDAPTASDTTLTTNEDTAGTVNLLALAHDTETTLTAGNITVGTATHGTASYNNSTGVVTYTPTANYNGSDSFTYTVADGDGGSVTKTVSVTITPVNDAPTASDTTLTTNEDTAGTVDLYALASDVDGALPKSSISVGSATHGTASYSTGTGLVTYTPNANYNGSDSFSYTVDDGAGGSVTKTVSVTVTPVNDAPTASDTTITTSEDTAGTVDLFSLAYDIDSTLTKSVISVSAATHGTPSYDSATGIVTYTPAADYFGSDSFTYTVTDGDGGSVTKTVTVTITAVNDAPTASDTTLTTNEDTAGTVNLLALAHDVDTALTGGNISVSAATHGTPVYDNATGIVTYTPDSNYNGSDSFTYTVNDGAGGTVTKTVSVTVTAVNDDPTASDTTLTTNEDTAGTVNLLSLSHDTETILDGSNIAVGTATHGILSYDSATGIVTYTPTANYNGSDSFTYTVDDGDGGSVTKTVAVTVTSINDAPTASDAAITTNEDTAGTLNLFDLAADIDSTLTNNSISVSAASHGTAAYDTATGIVTYTPAANYNGSDSFTYTVNDGDGGSVTKTVSVTVTAVNDAPTASDTTLTTNEDTAGTLNLLVLASDLETTITGSDIGIGSAAHGTATYDAGTGIVTYTPTADYNGSDSFTYTVSDGDGGSITKVVSVTVTPINDAPTAFDTSIITNEDTARTLNLLALAHDIDSTLTGGSITIGAATNGTAAYNSATGVVTYTPGTDYTGPDSFTYTVNDGAGGTVTHTVSVTVAPQNDAPTASDVTTSTNEDTAKTINLLALAHDTETVLDGSNITVDAAAHGTVAYDSGTGIVTYTPDANYNGTDSFTYTVDDGAGGNTATYTVTMTVDPVNDIPTASDTTLTTDEDTVGTVNLLALVHDVETTLTSSDISISAATHGTATYDSGTGIVTYTPDADYNGPDSFTYTVDDGDGGSVTKTVNVTVTSINDLPTASDTTLTTNEDTAGTVNLLALAHDLETTLTGSNISVGSATHGTAIYDSGTGIVTYTPDADYNGADSFTYTVTDGDGGSIIKTVSVTVTAVNDVPTASDTTITTNEDTTGTVNLLALIHDVETTLTGASITIGAATHGTAVYDNATGVAIYTPDGNYNGADSFTYTVNDGDGGSITKTVNVTVTSINDLPTASDTTLTTNEDIAGTLNLLALTGDVETVLDGSNISVGSATHGTAAYDTATGIVTYTPTANYNGADSFTYTVDDGDGGSVTKTVSVTVTSVNDVPTASDTTLTTSEDTAATLNLLALAHDVETTLTGADISVSAATHGTAAYDAATGIVTYTPTATYNGPDSFTYTVSDGDGGSVTRTVSVTVTAVNDVPTASDTTLTTNEDTAGTVNLLVLAHDVETTLTGANISISAATHGTATLDTGTGIVTYTPNANYNGADSFTYTIDDGDGGSVTKTVSVTVTAVNDAPTASDTTLTTNEDTAGTVNLLALASDIDTTLTGSNITIGSATHGTAIYDSATGIVTYTPSANYNGADGFTYTVNDGAGGSVVKTVSVTVTSVNDVPTASNTTLTTNEDTTGTLNLLALTGDVETVLDGSNISIGTATHGTAAYDSGTGIVTYTPDANYNGSDSFTYTVSDGDGGSVTKTVSVTVTSINDLPTASDTVLTTDEDTAGTLNLLALANDLETTLTGSNISVGSAGHGTVAYNSTNGVATYTPAANYNGSDSFTYTVTDGNGGTVTKTVAVTVTAINDVPTASNAPLAVNEDTAGTLNLLALSHDVETTLTGGDITIGAATHGTAVYDTGTGIVTYTPDTHYSGSDSFTYTVSDGNGGSVTKTVSVTVAHVNILPTASDTSLTTDEDTAGTVNLLALAHDTETALTGSNITVGAAAHGTASYNAATGIVTYTPGTNYNGTDVFSYTVHDGEGGTVTKTVTVTVTPENDAPVASDRTVTVYKNAATTVNLLALSHDPETSLTGGNITIGAVTNGTATYDAATGIVTYTPDADYLGADSFTYTVDDGDGGSTTHTISLNITTAPNTSGGLNILFDELRRERGIERDIDKGADGNTTISLGIIAYAGTVKPLTFSHYTLLQENVVLKEIPRIHLESLDLYTSYSTRADSKVFLHILEKTQHIAVKKTAAPVHHAITKDKVVPSHPAPAVDAQHAENMFLDFDFGPQVQHPVAAGTFSGLQNQIVAEAEKYTQARREFAQFIEG